jgi:hypothetical protein
MCLLKIYSLLCGKFYYKFASEICAFALNAHRPAVHLDQLTHDRKTQPKTAISRRHRIVLSESLEDVR